MRRRHDREIQLMTTALADPPAGRRSAWRQLWQREDYWAIWIGLAVIAAGATLFVGGGSLRWLAILPPKWSSLAAVAGDLAANWPRYLAQYVFWLVAFGLAVAAMGQPVRRFVISFTLLYLVAYAIFVIGQWESATRYNLEAPLLALFFGLAVANTLRLPGWLDAGFRGELFVKTGIVLLGATVPLSLLVQAGPVAIFQASIVSLATFGVIYWAAVKLGLGRPFAATLGVGGAVCGVSAAIAVSAAVSAKKEETAVTITTVVLWAIAMIFILPLASKALLLPTGVAGAWIGTSEFADAAGIAAAQTYGGYAGSVPGIAGTAEQALQAFTLMKVIGRDLWIGIWAVGLAIVATTRWERGPVSGRADPREIWNRFPKFILGFFIASALISIATVGYTIEEYNRDVAQDLVAPIKDLRTWTFILCFLSIGLTTRLRDLVSAGRRPMIAFTAGVAVNLVIGFALSVWVFGAHWANLGA